MRRKDREVTEFNEIVKIIDACEIIRIGLSDGDFPYIVPLNFGYEIKEKQICFYIHGAKAGRKFELLLRNGKCSFEMDISYGLDCMPEKMDVTTRYKSVMGCARAELLEGEDKMRAMDDYIMARNETTKNFEYNKSMLQHTAVFKLTVFEISGKANLSKKMLDSHGGIE